MQVKLSINNEKQSLKKHFLGVEFDGNTFTHTHSHIMVCYYVINKQPLWSYVIWLVIRKVKKQTIINLID